MKQHNLTGKIFTETMILMALTEIALTIATIVDGFMTSRFLGYEAMAGLGLVATVPTMLGLIGGVLSSGGQSICSRKLAEADAKSAQSIFQLVFMLSLLSGLLLSLMIILFPEPLIFLLGGRKSMGNVWQNTSDYLVSYAFGIPPLIAIIAVQPFFYLDGDRIRSALGIIFHAVINVLLDLTAIFIFHNGIWGIGLATSIATWCEALILATHFLKRDVLFKPVLSIPSFRYLKDILQTGTPIITRRGANILRKLSLNIIVGIVASGYGLAALSIQNQIKDFGDSLGVGIGTTMLLLTGITIGERNQKSLKNLWSIALSSIRYPAILAVVLSATAPLTARLFCSDAKAVPYVIFAIVCYAISLPLVAFNTMYSNYLQGSGQLSYANLMSLAQRLLYIVPCALLLSICFGMKGLFIAFPVSEALIVLTLIVWVQLKKRTLQLTSEDLLLLPKDFDSNEENQLAFTAYSMEDVVYLSKKVYHFCLHKNLDNKRAYLLSLFTEELGRNIIEYGFHDHKHSIDFQLIYDPESNLCSIHFRDDCTKFDPVEYRKIMDSYHNDISRNIGLRIVFGMAKDVKYVHTLRMNILLVTL